MRPLRSLVRKQTCYNLLCTLGLFRFLIPALDLENEEAHVKRNARFGYL